MKRDAWEYLRAVYHQETVMRAMADTDRLYLAPAIAADQVKGPTRSRLLYILRRWEQKGWYRWDREFWGNLTPAGREMGLLCAIGQEWEYLDTLDNKLVELDFLSDLGIAERPDPKKDNKGFWSYAGYYDSGPLVGIFKDYGDNGLAIHADRNLKWNGGTEVTRDKIAWVREIDRPKKRARLVKMYDIIHRVSHDGKYPLPFSKTRREACVW